MIPYSVKSETNNLQKKFNVFVVIYAVHKLQWCQCEKEGCQCDDVQG